MASRVGGVVQENSSVGWKITDASKGPRKGALVGRTPLGDLSNAQKRSLNQAPKKHYSSILPLHEKETGASQKKKSISLQSAGRKALSDVSNSGMPKLKEGLKNNNFAKLSVLEEEEPIDASEIGDEQFLHNHEECIKAQSKTMDLESFLQIIGLESDHSKDEEIPLPYQSPPREFLWEEMPEELIMEEKSWNEFSVELDSPPPLRSHRYFVDYECNFELKGSP